MKVMVTAGNWPWWEMESGRVLWKVPEKRVRSQLVAINQVLSLAEVDRKRTLTAHHLPKEQIAKMQAMLSRLTEPEKTQLIEMLVRKYGTDADIKGLFGPNAQQKPVRDDSDEPPPER